MTEQIYLGVALVLWPFMVGWLGRANPDGGTRTMKPTNWRNAE